MANKQDRWPELLKLVSQPDRLPVRDAGSWTERKLYFWNRYIDITTSSMVGHPNWPEGLVYVDLFAGPGICEVRDTRKRFPGSPLIAAYAPKAFRKILLCERDSILADALVDRLRRSPAAGRFEVFIGDCNDRVRDIVTAIPSGTLTLAFIDPEGLHQSFETIQTLAQRGRVDLLILLADSMDIVRNVDRYYAQSHSNLDDVMGPASEWRSKWDALSNRTRDNICKLFANEYRRQLSRLLGYKVFGEREMQSPRGPLYRLIFASKHERGLDFWHKVSNVDLDGQTEFGF